MSKKRSLGVFNVFVAMLLVGVAYAELESVDIGDASKNPGSTEIDDGVYTIKGSGSDIWDAADGFRYAYTEVQGDFEAEVHQVSVDLPHEWAKGGIHARQSIDPGAANAQVIVTGSGGGGCQITWRTVANGITNEFLDVAPGAWADGECWLRLTRQGNDFSGFISEDGEEWIDLKATTIEVDDPILIGLAVCGLGNMATGVYDNFRVTQGGRDIFPAAVTKTENHLAVMWGKIKGY